MIALVTVDNIDSAELLFPGSFLRLAAIFTCGDSI